MALPRRTTISSIQARKPCVERGGVISTLTNNEMQNGRVQHLPERKREKCNISSFYLFRGWLASLYSTIRISALAWQMAQVRLTAVQPSMQRLWYPWPQPRTCSVSPNIPDGWPQFGGEHSASASRQIPQLSVFARFTETTLFMPVSLNFTNC